MAAMLRQTSILQQQIWSRAADIIAPGQNHGDLELFSKDIQHVSHP